MAGSRTRDARRVVVAVLATLAVLTPLGWWWGSSLMPGSYSMAGMGYPDYGGGPTGMDMSGARSVDTLRDTSPGPPDVAVTLTARAQTYRLATGETVAGYTLNGSSPGPEVRARQGDLVAVTLVNESVPRGVTLHWHGLDVPNGDDGVAGITQDAVPPGRSFVYRFRVGQAGTYWYHSHQVADEQVRGGMFGALVVTPRDTAPTASPTDVTAITHLYGGRRAITGRTGDTVVPAAPGIRVRVRVTNTDNGPIKAWSSALYRVLAVDGTDVHAPTPVAEDAVAVTAGGRVDLEVTAPARVTVGGDAAVVVGDPAASPPSAAVPAGTLDLLSYGSPAPLGFDPAVATRHFEYAVGRRPGFLDGQPGLWWTVNGHLYPDVPMFVVREGDVVRMHITNTSGDVHPMHLHGHHAVVLARNGVAATGSPWWVDTLTVADGESYDIAFVADNPGLWMDHCHNLGHAAQGLIAHLMYEGVNTPYRAGADTPNVPE